jgi:hypothetical protein
MLDFLMLGVFISIIKSYPTDKIMVNGIKPNLQSFVEWHGKYPVFTIPYQAQRPSLKSNIFRMH